MSTNQQTNEQETALLYLPNMYIDQAETIPLRYVGYQFYYTSTPSTSFRRTLTLPDDCAFIIEYCFYWDYDIQHMYDLEHIWVYVGNDKNIKKAEGSFHGKFLNLYAEDLVYAQPPKQTHVNAYCQPGKHAFLPAGQLFRLYPFWKECCTTQAGGKILVGGPFKDQYQPTPSNDALCNQWIQTHLTFEPTLEFIPYPISETRLISWNDLYKLIPSLIEQECNRLDLLEHTKE